MKTKKPPILNDKIVENGIFALIITGLTIAFGLLIGEVQSKVGLSTLLIALCFFLGIYGITIWLIQRPLYNLLATMLHDVKQEINAKSTPFIVTTEQLVEYEARISSPEVWVLTADLLDDIEGAPFGEAVKANVRKGIKYVYFIPNTYENKARVVQVQAAHNNSQLVKFIYLPDTTFFFLVTNLDIVIYDPLSQSSTPRTAFMGLPTPTHVPHYQLEISREFLDRLVGNLLELYNQS